MRKLLHVAATHSDDVRDGAWLRAARTDAPHRLVEEYTYGELCAVYAAVAAACPPSAEADVAGRGLGEEVEGPVGAP